MSIIALPSLGLDPGAADGNAALLRSYPRPRPPLSAAHQRIYLQEYRRNRGTEGDLLFRVTGALEAWMHRRIAERKHGNRLLELGAGTLNHLQYDSAGHYDVVEPLPELHASNPLRDRISNRFADIAEIPDHARYDRVFSVAVLEHVQDLPRLVARSGLLLERDGIFQAGIPSEGGLLWQAAWRLTTGVAYRLRTGLPYAPVMRHEHINTADEVIAVIRYFFRSVQLKWHPLGHRDASFYCYIEARDPDASRCDRWGSSAAVPGQIPEPEARV